MSATNVSNTSSLKRKLEDTDPDLDLPSAKRQKLNDDNFVKHQDKTPDACTSANMIINNSTLYPLSENHVSALHDTLHALQTKLKAQHNLEDDLLTDASMTQLAQFAPISVHHLTHFDSLNEVNITKFGSEIMCAITDYLRSNALESPFHNISSNTSETNTNNGSIEDKKDDSILQNTNNATSDCKEIEATAIPIRRKKKRFIDSESEDEATDICTSSNTKKFVYGHNIETVGHKIQDVIDENEEDGSDEEQDDDLDGFVVADEEDDEEDGFNGRILRRNGGDMDRDEANAFFDEISSEHDIETLETNEDSDDSIELIGRNNRRNATRNNHNRHNLETAEIDDDEEDENEDITHRNLERLDTTDSIRHQLLRFHADEVMDEDMEAEEGEAIEDDIDDMEDRQHMELGDDCHDSDGESLNSIDDEIDREIFGIDDVRFADLSFENAIKRKSLVDMIKIFENGVNIKLCSFWMEYGQFMKTFTNKATKAIRLISVLFPLGFGDNTMNEEVGIFDTALFKLEKRNNNNEIHIDKQHHPQEYELMKCMNSKQYKRIPALVEEGVSPNIIPKFFVHMDEFRMIIIRKWFDAITFQNIGAIKEYHALYGIPVDLSIPRKIIKHVLETDFEHLEGATGLVIASLVGSLQIVKYFVENGADIECHTSFGNDTALMFAAKRGNISVVKYLCDKGADINATTTQSEAYADTPSPVAFEALLHQKKEVLEYLAYHGADLYLRGPHNGRGENVSVMRLCLMEEKYGLKEIKNGLKKRFDFIKQCLSEQFPIHVDIMNNIGVIICDEFLNPTHNEYINALIAEYMIDCDDVYDDDDDDDMHVDH